MDGRQGLYRLLMASLPDLSRCVLDNLTCHDGWISEWWGRSEMKSESLAGQPP